MSRGNCRRTGGGGGPCQQTQEAHKTHQRKGTPWGLFKQEEGGGHGEEKEEGGGKQNGRRNRKTSATACVDCLAGKHVAFTGNDSETDCVACMRY